MAYAKHSNGAPPACRQDWWEQLLAALPKQALLALRDVYMDDLAEVEAFISPLAQACTAKERRLELQVSEERLPTSYPPATQPAHCPACSFAAWLIG